MTGQSVTRPAAASGHTERSQGWPCKRCWTAETRWVSSTPRCGTSRVNLQSYVKSDPGGGSRAVHAAQRGGSRPELLPTATGSRASQRAVWRARIADIVKARVHGSSQVSKVDVDWQGSLPRFNGRVSDRTYSASCNWSLYATRRRRRARGMLALPIVPHLDVPETFVPASAAGCRPFPINIRTPRREQLPSRPVVTIALAARASPPSQSPHTRRGTP